MSQLQETTIPSTLLLELKTSLPIKLLQSCQIEVKVDQYSGKDKLKSWFIEDFLLMMEEELASHLMNLIQIDKDWGKLLGISSFLETNTELFKNG